MRVREEGRSTAFLWVFTGSHNSVFPHTVMGSLEFTYKISKETMDSTPVLLWLP
jgi:hypothetical protein